MSNFSKKEKAVTYNLESDIKRVFADVPDELGCVSIYPAGLNFCECHLLSEAIQSLHPGGSYAITNGEQEGVELEVTDLTAEFLHELTINEHGTGCKLRGPADFFHFQLQRDSAFAVLAGTRELVKRAIPFPKSVWETYFFEIMQAQESEPTIKKIFSELKSRNGQ